LDAVPTAETRPRWVSPEKAITGSVIAPPR
jgi:hypothetical protein